ncbi:putative actin-related protein RO7 [Talaromyces proteolyticus]|uniref:Actin-related protein RO7 n=1 Tax=Talaromyces proteolyticus TaxID=1131652 RepID=A0AAD4PWT0_9EURO|nr:putative actin-related protein RO7 [Talaromyces proteolyticus]KAH8695440.1 putative actin-related protein RO7 [Talaromyces proteolyticus]
MKTKQDANTGEQKEWIDAEEWAKRHELWRMDLRETDLGLVDDKIERAFREIYNNYLLTDAGNARLVLVLPSVIPHPLLSRILTSLFNRWRFPSITLLPSAAMTAAAAGLRTALVVDIGWAETTVTAIYEYRETSTKRTTRAMKSLLQEMGKMLSNIESSTEEATDKANDISVKFEYCEEVVNRFAWCKFRETDETPDKVVSIPSPSKPDSGYVQVPLSRFAKPVEDALFANGADDHELDDHEKPVHVLVYHILLALPPDVRGACMSRIVFVGGGSKIPGVRQRVMKDVSSLVIEHGWDSMRGRAVRKQKSKQWELAIRQPHQDEDQSQNGTKEDDEPEKSAEQPGQQPQQQSEELDFVEKKLRRKQPRDSKPFIQGQFRQVDSLGPWAGASLVTSLKIRGFVEIEREKFLQHGMAGATRDPDSHHVADRRSGIRSSMVSDRSSWTLAGWG